MTKGDALFVLLLSLRVQEQLSMHKIPLNWNAFVSALPWFWAIHLCSTCNLTRTTYKYIGGSFKVQCGSLNSVAFTSQNLQIPFFTFVVSGTVQLRWTTSRWALTFGPNRSLKLSVFWKSLEMTADVRQRERESSYHAFSVSYPTCTTSRSWCCGCRFKCA